MSYFAVWATDRPDGGPSRARLRESHRARLRNPGEHSVRVVAGGPTLDEASGAMKGTLLVIEAATIDAVRAFMAGDPYVLAGDVYASLEIRPWQWSLGAPGS